MGFKTLSDLEVLIHQCLLEGNVRGKRCIYKMLGEKLGILEKGPCKDRHAVIEYLTKNGCNKNFEKYKKEQFDENH